MEQIEDLLSTEKQQEKLQIREHPMKFLYVNNLSSYLVRNIMDIQDLLCRGNTRHVHNTCMMGRSSVRVNKFVDIKIFKFNGTELLSMGKVSFVELACCSRHTSRMGSSSGSADGVGLREVTHIGTSLSPLGNIISSLSNPQSANSFVPYRDSKVTRLLQAALGGESRTVFISHVSSSPIMDHDYDENLSILRYSKRVQMIVNTPKTFEMSENIQKQYSTIKQDCFLHELCLKAICRHAIRGRLQCSKRCDAICELPLPALLKSYIGESEQHFSTPIKQTPEYPWFCLTSTRHYNQKHLRTGGLKN